ncbi:CASP-like protein 1 [Tanacetum coccineum]
MATIDTKPPSRAAYDMETTMKWSASLQDGVKNHAVVDATLRAVLFATTNVALIAMVTSKETKMIPISPTMKVLLDASFNESPAYIYYVSAITLFFGIVASATGAAAAVGYIGIKGNSHSRWNKFCNIYRSFCHQMEVSVSMSLISTLALMLLVCHSFYRNKVARK